MSFAGKSFLSVENLNRKQVNLLFSCAKAFKEEFRKKGSFFHLICCRREKQGLVAMVFLEPSTRTRLSFQTAAYRVGLESYVFDSARSSSMEKGESQVNTLKNIAAMLPDVMVVRYGFYPEVDKALLGISCPIINAGNGIIEHPTQALLDAFTIQNSLGTLEGKKVLIVGDVAYSRVANSNLKLLSILGAEVAICGPEAMFPQTEIWAQVRKFTELKEAVSWCDVLMGLRIQTERHGEKSKAYALAEYRDNYQVKKEHLKLLGEEGLLMHPGPVIHGVEFSPQVLQSPQSMVLEQVTNGVFVRAALFTMVLGMEVEVA